MKSTQLCTFLIYSFTPQHSIKIAFFTFAFCAQNAFMMGAYWGVFYNANLLSHFVITKVWYNSLTSVWYSYELAITVIHTCIIVTIQIYSNKAYTYILMEFNTGHHYIWMLRFQIASKLMKHSSMLCLQVSLRLLIVFL